MVCREAQEVADRLFLRENNICAFVDEPVRPGAHRVGNAARHGIDVPPLLQGEVRSDERARPLPGFHNDDPGGKAGNQPVSRGEVLSERSLTGRQLRDHCPVFNYLII